MKLFIRTVLTTILVLIHIRELNASQNWNEGSDPRYQYRNFLGSGGLHEEAHRQQHSLFAGTSQSGEMQSHSQYPQNTQYRQLQRAGHHGTPRGIEPDTRLSLCLPGSHPLDERRQNQLLQKLQKEFPLAKIEVLKVPVIINCFAQKILAYIAKINFSHKPILCERIEDDHPISSFIPNAEHRDQNNMYATAECRNHDIICIAYLDERGKIFGVKPPPNIGTKRKADDPERLIPTAFQSYITCSKHEYQLTLDPPTGIVTRIIHLPHNTLPTDNNGKTNIKTGSPIICCGVRFKAHRTEKSKIVGAELFQDGIPQKLFNSKYVAIL